MGKIFQSKKTNKLAVVFFVIASFTLAGCQSTQTNISSVGPSIGGTSAAKVLGQKERAYKYTSNIFLDVAIPVFDPGIPSDKYGNVDDKAVVEKDIWPQVRRLEANRFALYTKEALTKSKLFGSINVTPDAGASADVYVLGKINYSDTETIKIGVRVMDATNTLWGEKDFEYQVSEGFYRDALRKEGNPYGPVFINISRYVQSLLIKKSEEEKNNIKLVSDVRYAAMYSPEVFSAYLTEKKTSFFSNSKTISLVGAPSESDPMYQRISAIKAKDAAFVDTLQDSYETFQATSHDAYRDYHRETLPVAAQIRKAKIERTKSQIATGILAVLAVAASKQNTILGEVAAVGGGLLAANSLINAVNANRVIGAQRKILDEMGQNLDIKVTPQVVEFNDQSIELKGTASEQHAQLRSRLLEIHEIENQQMGQL
jgi:hypothetical protein